MARKRQSDKYCSEKEAYENLAIAVVKQAAKDYLGVCRRLEKKPGSRAAEQEKRKLEEFFLGDYCCMITNGVGGEVILDRLRMEARL